MSKSLWTIVREHGAVRCPSCWRTNKNSEGGKVAVVFSVLGLLMLGIYQGCSNQATPLSVDQADDAHKVSPDTRSDQEKIDSAAKQLAAAVANAPPLPIARKVANQVEDEFSTLVHADPTLRELCIDLGKVRAAWIAAGVAPTAELWGQTRDRACAFASSHDNVHLSTFKGSADKSKQDFYDEITGLAF